MRATYHKIINGREISTGVQIRIPQILNPGCNLSRLFLSEGKYTGERLN